MNRIHTTRSSPVKPLIWAAVGTMVAAYAAHKSRKSRLGEAVSASKSRGLMAVVSEPGPAGQPIPRAAQRVNEELQRTPVAEDPYPPDNPSPLPTGPAPGG